jgi:hypothetical protein
MASRRRDIGALSPRLLDLSAKTVPQEPYPVSADGSVVIRQTRKRRDDLHDAYTELVTCQERLTALIKRAGAMTAPETPGGDATAEQTAAHAEAVAEYTQQIDRMNSEADTYTARLTAAADKYNRALFGEAYDTIMELTAQEPPEFFEAIKADIQDYFTQNVHPPPDGHDTNGAVVDMDEAVEAGKSPT